MDNEKERFETYKKVVNKPTMTLKEFRRRENRFQPVGQIIKLFCR